MCLIVLAHRAVPGIDLLVAANRDEFFERPALPAAFWPDHPDILAGRDRKAGGTWLGVTRSGRFAAITNYRNPRERRSQAPSRGALVSDFLKQGSSPQEYMQGIEAAAREFNGFSLLAGAAGELWFYSNRDSAASSIPPGIHGLSNRLLDEPWPKVTRSKAWLADLLERPFDPEACFELLADETPAADGELPDTGIGLERERKSSAIRLRDPLYGTRCSTLLIVRSNGEAQFQERSFNPDGSPAGKAAFTFMVSSQQDPSTSARAQSPPPRKPRLAP